MIRFLFCIFLLSNLGSASELENRLGVINGDLVSPSEPIAKAIVMVGVDQFFGGGSCSGVLIAENVALTAAHCVLAGFGAVGSEVKFQYANNPSCGVAKVDQVLFHPDSIADNDEEEGQSKLPDFSVIHLSTPLCGAVPAILPAEPVIKESELLMLAGYGTGNRSSEKAEKTKIKILADAESILNIYRGEEQQMVEELTKFLAVNFKYYRFGVPSTQFSGICSGDSGGPAYIEKDNVVELVGINSIGIPHSAGSPNCQNSYLFGVANLLPYTPWIKEQLAKWKSL